MLDVHETHLMSDTVRCVWGFDSSHETVGSYGYDTPEETKAAEQYELERLESGEWAALYCMVEHLCSCCGEWAAGDALHGIVIELDTDKLKEYARENMDLDPKPNKS